MFKRKIRILEGKLMGHAGYVPYEWVKKKSVPEKIAEEGTMQQTSKCIAVGMLFVLVGACAVFGQEIKGFRELTFGMSVDAAKKVYPDLQPSVAGSWMGAVGYARTGEDLNIGDVKFDNISYFFNDTGFCLMRAEIKRSERMGLHLEHLKLKKSIELKYGPSEKEDRSQMPGGAIWDSSDWVTGPVSVGVLHITGDAPESSLVLAIKRTVVKHPVGF